MLTSPVCHQNNLGLLLNEARKSTRNPSGILVASWGWAKSQYLLRFRNVLKVGLSTQRLAWERVRIMYDRSGRVNKTKEGY